MANNDATIKIGADDSELKSALKRIEETIRTSVKSIEDTFSGAQGSITKVNSALAALGAVLAGGAAFKSAIDESKKLAGEAGALARTLGIGATEASVLNTALGDVGLTADEFTGAAAHLERQLRKNEAGLNAMGLKTRDANGEYRNLQDIMMDATRVLAEYKAGTDRNLAAQQMFGKGAEEAMKMMKLSNQVIDEARKKNQELGLTITQGNVEANKKYKMAMNDLGDVLSAVKKTIGDALMPVLTRLAEWFNQIAPPAVFAFRVALDSISTAIQVVIGLARQLWIVFTTVFDGIGSIGYALRKLMTGDINGAGEALASGIANWGEQFATLGDRMKTDAQRTMNDIKGIWSQTAADKVPGGAGRKSYVDTEKTTQATDKSQMPGFEAALAALKLAHDAQNEENGTFYEFTKQREAEFWKSLLDTNSMSEEDRVRVMRKWVEVRLGIRKDEFDATMATLKAQADAYKNNADAKLAILTQQSDLVSQKYGKESKQYADIQGEIVAVKRAAAEQIQKIDEIRVGAQRAILEAEVDAAEQSAQLQLSLGLITTTELLEQQKQFELRRTQIQSAALQERMAILGRNPGENAVELATTQAQIEALWLRHGKRITEIRHQQVIESNHWSQQLVDQMTDGLGRMTTALLNGTMRWNQIFRASWQGMLGILTNIAGQMVTKWTSTEIAKTLATITGTRARTAAEEEGASESLLVTAGAAVKQIMINAWEAMAGAFQAMVSIPYVGPILAVAAGAAAFGAVAAIAGNIASASGGYDIPAGVSPMTQLHEREMVLPAHIADPLRNMIAGGGSSGAGNIQIIVNATDAQSVKRLLMNNNSAVHAALKQALRNGVT